MAVYLGHSPDHATNAPLVLNTRTGLVSPQYHVVFDDDFTTTKSLKTDTLPTNWKVLFPSLSTCLDDAQAITHTLADEWQDPHHLRRLLILLYVLALLYLLMKKSNESYFLALPPSSMFHPTIRLHPRPHLPPFLHLLTPLLQSPIIPSNQLLS